MSSWETDVVNSQNFRRLDRIIFHRPKSGKEWKDYLSIVSEKECTEDDMKDCEEDGGFGWKLAKIGKKCK